MVDEDTRDAIIRDAMVGKKARHIARDRGVSMADVTSVINRAASEAFKGEALRRLSFLEIERLEALKQRLFARAYQDDNTAMSLYLRASERLASLTGVNHPQGHIVTVTSSIQPVEGTSTQLMIDAVRELRGEKSVVDADVVDDAPRDD